ncbi:MAG: hypothetical protein ACLUG8_03020 [[Eubacterium] siraeum]
MIVNCIKKTLAGILALSLIAGSVSIQTFADEIEQYVPQWIITTSGNDVLNPSKNVLVSTAKGNYPITDAIVKSNMVYTLCKHMVYMLSITNEHKK